MNENPTPINPVCHQMLNCRLTGNITPISWFRNILTGSGKPDVVAIILLSDIVYWYTPVMTRDEHTGDVIGIQQKFQADKLQKTYQEYADIFGFSKNQIKNAIDNLCSQGLITREFRHIKTGTGLAITNVMYIEPIFDNIVKISNKIRSPQKVEGYPPKKLGDIPSKRMGISPQKNGGPPPKKFGDLPPKNGGTYTKTTTKNSTENTTATTTASEAAVVSFENRFPEPVRSLIPEIYQDHKDVLASIEAYLQSHGQSYVVAELDYAITHSTKNGGFPAFLKLSLANGWGTENLKVQQAAKTNSSCGSAGRKKKSLKRFAPNNSTWPTSKSGIGRSIESFRIRLNAYPPLSLAASKPKHGLKPSEKPLRSEGSKARCWQRQRRSYPPCPITNASRYTKLPKPQ
jgi:hypothetical protein